MKATKVKPNSGSLFGSKRNVALNYPNRESLLALLNTIMMPRKGEATVTPKEAAVLCGYKSDRMIYAILKGEKVLKAECYQVLAFECANRGDLRLIESITPNEYHVAHNDCCTANGTALDDNGRLTIAAAHYLEAENTHDTRAMDEALVEMETAFHGFHAERKLVR